MSGLDVVSITPSLAFDVKINEIKDKILKRMDELRLNDCKYKTSTDVILLICNLVEHLVRDKKINKKELVIEIMDGVYSLTPDERKQISGVIEFLHSNKAIKKLSRFYLFCVGVYEYFSRSKKG